MADAALAALNANAPYRVVGLSNQLLGWPSQLLLGAFMASVVARLRRRQVLPAAAMQAAPALPSSLVRTAAPRWAWRCGGCGHHAGAGNEHLVTTAKA